MAKDRLEAIWLTGKATNHVSYCATSCLWARKCQMTTLKLLKCFQFCVPHASNVQPTVRGHDVWGWDYLQVNMKHLQPVLLTLYFDMSTDIWLINVEWLILLIRNGLFTKFHPLGYGCYSRFKEHSIGMNWRFQSSLECYVHFSQSIQFLMQKKSIYFSHTLLKCKIHHIMEVKWSVN